MKQWYKGVVYNLRREPIGHFWVFWVEKRQVSVRQLWDRFLLSCREQVNNTTRTTTERQTRDNASVTDRVKRRDFLP